MRAVRAGKFVWGLRQKCHAYQPEEEVEACIPDEPQSLSRGRGSWGRDSLAEEPLDGPPLAKEVHDVLDDQTRRGMLLRLREAEAKAKYPHLVIASLGADRKDTPNGEVTARVLHDGTNGLAVNTKTRLWDQDHSPTSSGLKRAMREKPSRGLRMFALTADVKEAHRQIPIDPRDWHLLDCHLERGADVFINTVGTFDITSASYYWFWSLQQSAGWHSTSRQTRRRPGTWSFTCEFTQ